MSGITPIKNVFTSPPEPSGEGDIDAQAKLALQSTTDLLKQSINNLDDFSSEQLPQIQDSQEQLLASLEKLAQQAQIQKK